MPFKDLGQGDIGTIIILAALLFISSFAGLWTFPGLMSLLIYIATIFIAFVLWDLIHASDKSLQQHFMFSIMLGLAIYIANIAVGWATGIIGI